MTMFDPNERDMLRTLGTMANTAVDRNFGNKLAARETLKNYIQTDKRFDQYDAATLAKRVEECRSCGAKLDLTDPRLMGRPARPLERDQSW
jgi:hypothetical protein